MVSSRCLKGDHAGGFVGDGGPGGAAVGGAIEVCAGGGVDAGVNGLRGVAGGGGAFVEEDEGEAGGGAGKSGEVGPGVSGVDAFPEAVAGGAEKEDVAVVGIDLEAFAGAAAIFVSAEFEGEVGAAPGLALVGGIEDGGVFGPGGGVLSDRFVDVVGVGGVGGEGEDAGELGIVAAEGVVERDPGGRGVVPAVGAADIGAGVDQILLGGGEFDAVDETAAGDWGVGPSVGLGEKKAGFVGVKERGAGESASMGSGVRHLNP